MNKNQSSRSKKNIMVIDSKRTKKYNKINISVGDRYYIPPQTGEIKISAYTIELENVDISITIEKETKHQYKVKIDFGSDVRVNNSNHYDYWWGAETESLKFGIKKLNLNDFLGKYSPSFKREFGISKLMDW